MAKQKDEVWKVLGTFTKYAISDHGRILNLRTGEFMKGTETKYGYLRVQLYQDGRHQYGYIHRMVAEFFMKDYDNCYGIEHTDNDRKNNHINNLVQSEVRRRPSRQFS